jgi:O-methyltransferase involved in polyketide biosynthesis
MENKHQVGLGAVQETLFIPLAARARETQRKHPVLRDPRAVELVQSIDYDTAKYGRGAGGRISSSPTECSSTCRNSRSWPRWPASRSDSPAP